MTAWTVARQAPLSMGFSRQEHWSGLPFQEDWSGLPFSSPGGLPDSGIEPESPALKVDSLLSESAGKPLTLRQFTRLRLEDCYHVKEGLSKYLCRSAFVV